MAARLNPESIDGWLRARAGWKKDGKQLVKEYRFPKFRDAIVFVNRVAGLADDHNHHPDIDIRYRKVTLRLITHDAGPALTFRDPAVAADVDRVR